MRRATRLARPMDDPQADSGHVFGPPRLRPKSSVFTLRAGRGLLTFGRLDSATIESGAGGTLTLVSFLDRITVDPQVCHGAPTVRGLRYPVEMIVNLLASGMTTAEVLVDYPDLETNDVLASLEYAALVTKTRSSVPISAA